MSHWKWRRWTRTEFTTRTADPTVVIRWSSGFRTPDRICWIGDRWWVYIGLWLEIVIEAFWDTITVGFYWRGSHRFLFISKVMPQRGFGAVLRRVLFPICCRLWLYLENKWVTMNETFVSYEQALWERDHDINRHI